MTKQIPETEQWLLDGNCDKCRKDKYCDKHCGPYKKALNKALKESWGRAIKKAQDQWQAEHPYLDKKGVRYKTQEEADKANKLIEEGEKKNESKTFDTDTIDTDNADGVQLSANCDTTECQ